MQIQISIHMHFRKFIQYSMYALFFNVLCIQSFSQKAANTEIKKPDKYENRKLGSEKSAGKKFTVVRRVTQNTFTHYNYYFNADLRLNEVVNRAKASYKDDYSQLLSFYNYSLDVTAQDKSELDSVIYKSSAGILLHDLRNDWIDNMYLILAKAYFFRKDHDSAGMTLQYLNFAFAPKEKGGYDIPIGSNSSNEQGEFSIATKEKASILKKLTGRPPSRNESFIWQIRNNIEMNELPEAAGIIEILRHDPNFPKRLKTDLNEVISYWFYKQQVYDSSAYYLAAALHEAEGRQEQARWEFLIGQMYQLASQPENATEYYEKSIKHTHDPVMDVYARLNSIHINRDANKKNYLQQNIDELLKMARKDKYENYRDIIYYAAAKIEMELKNDNAAQDLLIRSIKYSGVNPAQRSASFLLLADFNYDNKKYVYAADYYDSTDVNVLPLPADKERALLRKPPLKTIADNILTITKEDSLQALARLPAAQRDAILKKKAKELRKEKGLKEEDFQSNNPAVLLQASNLFNDNNNSKSGDFYFYNASMKSRGFSEFRSRWGQRPNVDNWRRVSNINVQNGASPDMVNNLPKNAAVVQGNGDDISSASLAGSIPLTPEKLSASNKSIADALYSTAQTFMVKLEEYASAAEVYEELLRRFPDSQYKDEAMFNLIYCYQKTGDLNKSDAYRKQLLNSTNGSKWAQLLKSSGGKKEGVNNVATKKYEEIYNLFIEGNFDKAKNEKRVADSIYGKNFWTPQLLYIESIYYIKVKEDSTATGILNNIASIYPGTQMADKAQTMMVVLKHRKEIEDYLTKLQVTRADDRPANSVDRVSNIPKVNIPKEDKKDTASKSVVKTETIKPLPVLKNFSITPTDPQYVVVLLDKVDEVYASEAKNAFNRYNREKLYNQKIELTSLKLDDRFQLVLQGPFTDAGAAITYIDNIKPVAASRILPWLKSDKYSFIVISAANLEALKVNKDMDTYKQVLQQAFPGKF